MMELNRVVPGRVAERRGQLQHFIEKRAAFQSGAGQGARGAGGAGAARGGVAAARGQGAHAQIEGPGRRSAAVDGILTDLDERRAMSSVAIDFTASDRRTKKLIEPDHVRFGYDERVMFRDLDLVLGPGQRLGLAGPNGSGKTTLLSC